MFYRIAQVMGEFNKESIKYQQNLFLNARKKPLPLIISDKSFIVGVTGFEPATSRPPAERATKLRHTPLSYVLLTFLIIAHLPRKCKYFFQIFLNFFKNYEKTRETCGFPGTKIFQKFLSKDKKALWAAWKIFCLQNYHKVGYYIERMFEHKIRPEEADSCVRFS